MSGSEPVPLVRGPGKTRMLLTFLCFLCFLSAGAAILTRVLIVPSKPAETMPDSRADIPQNPEADWFYDSIGQGSQLTTSVKPAVKAENSYTLEIKLANSREEAEKIIGMLAKMDVQAYYTPVSRGGRVVYRVRRGLFPNKSLARKAAKKLRSQKNLATKVVVLQ